MPRTWIPRPGPRSLKSFRLPCQVQRLEVSVVHVVDRVLHCTVHTDHLVVTRGPLQAKSTCTRPTASGASETEKKHPQLPLNVGIWTVVRRTPRKDDIDRNNKLNNRITIISKEQTAVHHSNRHVDVFKTRLLMKPLITLFFAFVQPPYF